jgi:hypothetical protein
MFEKFLKWLLKPIEVQGYQPIKKSEQPKNPPKNK